jgi:hypothetical protein
MERLARLVVVGVLLLPATGTDLYAQGLATIAGVVRDTSGAVLPGVTVEASSTALIERAANPWPARDAFKIGGSTAELAQDANQSIFIHDGHVIETLASDRADEPLHKPRSATGIAGRCGVPRCCAY